MPSGDVVVLSVIMPVFNEANTVSEVLDRLLRVPQVGEIIVVDDASNDETAERLQAWRGIPSVVLLQHKENRGKGAAIRTGLSHVRGRFVVIQDADLEYDPADYPRLIEPLLKGGMRVVYGSRRLGRGWQPGEWLNIYSYGVSLLNVLVWLWYGVRLTDEATCLKMFPTWVLQAMELECERFEFCPEVTAKACRMRLEIVEVPVSYTRRGFCEGKKIRFRDLLEAVGTLWHWRRWEPQLG